jgi:hypothetical protein
MKNSLILIVLMLACQLNEPLPLGSATAPLLGATAENPNPLTFWWWAGNGAELRPALECALERIRAATCLPVDVSFDAHHWVRQKPPELMNGRLGSTNGTFDESRISLKAPMGPQTNCRVLVHEIAQHVLQRRNDDGHVAPAFQLSAPLLENICAIWPCGCMVPETEDNPVESTQGVCIE